MNPTHLNSLFPGLSPAGHGGFYVQQTGGASSPSTGLAGEADVMMISGLAAEAVNAPQGVSVVGAGLPAPTLAGQLQFPVTIGTITLPLWQWLVIAALLGGAGGYYLGRR